MKRRDVIRRIAAAALLPAGASLAAGQQQQQVGRRGRMRGGRRGMRGRGGRGAMQMGGRPQGATVGEVAPDFKLMPIKLYDFQAAAAEVNLQTAAGLFQPIALSEFTGKKPVALIFGSYT